MLAPASLEGAGDGIDVAYYLVHSMGRGSGAGLSAWPSTAQSGTWCGEGEARNALGRLRRQRLDDAKVDLARKKAPIVFDVSSIVALYYGICAERPYNPP